MKKKALIIINNLHCGGAEKALISLLETIDYTRYEVDLFLFKHEGLFLRNVPESVNVLKEPKNYSLFDMSIKKALNLTIKMKRIDLLIYRLLAGLIFKTEKNKAKCEQRVWKYIRHSLGVLEDEYDLAIGYLEKNPIYFCMEKVKAKRKVGFIHTHYSQLGMDPRYDRKYFEKLDNIITVSSECAVVLKKIFPACINKIEVMHNIISPKLIYSLANEKNELQQIEAIKIVSVGRLNLLKGHDLAIEACKKLVEEQFNIKWYVIGEGEERRRLELLIRETQLENHFFLLGVKENPYSYLKEASIYVHPSRFEGKSIAVDEAKILKKPIILTKFSTAKDQIQNEKNGLIVEMQAESIAAAVKRLLQNEKLRNSLINNLSKESLGTEAEIEKFYSLFQVG
ncbi:glycosyltransferase [Sutcliffiella horikoshii]|uniref:Glycosyltransferase n=1 Tax=Sutcliffiella horikoshii TaxID=79883 RepID=A0AA95B7K3_9BACI|nr:glycosyltransferase [Sutcliffiella horikoshii]TYS60079.1 glycosyltransferase [Sutcliffiella horikoshii]